MATKPRRISDFAPMEDVRPSYDKAEQHLAQDLLLHGIEMQKGDKGEYALLDVSDPSKPEEEHFIISCGGKIVLAQLERVTPDMYPLMVAFYKSGRQIYMK